MSVPRFMWRFWNEPHRLKRESPHSRIRNKRFVQVPGFIGDRTDRGQPKRFEKWHKLPRSAHRLFWRTHLSRSPQDGKAASSRLRTSEKSMNCKPNDLAVLVGSRTAGGKYNGCLVRCIELRSEDYWYVEVLSPILFEMLNPETTGIWDKKLKPLRDPGEDARDETLIWKSVPSSSKEAA